jgi:prepilin-type processing-associated H-X9-DG protein
VAKSDAEIFMKHSEGMNLAYLDGHVKWMKDARVPTDGASNNGKGSPFYWSSSNVAPTRGARTTRKSRHLLVHRGRDQFPPALLILARTLRGSGVSLRL